jgi:ABC-2 type transport system ATP-binding protein
MSQYVLEVEGLCKSFSSGLLARQRQVLFDVSFRLPKGETCGFVGGNGQGKTTTLKCLLGFIRPQKGKIHFFGEALSLENRARYGFLPERPYLYEFLTANEFLLLHWRLAGRVSRNDFRVAAKRVLQLVGLEHVGDLRLRSFSKGMLQRIGLAQAILHDPEFLILDEPMSGLDPDGRIMVKDILREQKQRGVSIFFSSHLLQDMDELCTHLTVIDRGVIKYDGFIEGFRREHSDLELAYRALRRQQEGLK